MRAPPPYLGANDQSNKSCESVYGSHRPAAIRFNRSEAYGRNPTCLPGLRTTHKLRSKPYQLAVADTIMRASSASPPTIQ